MDEMTERKVRDLRLKILKVEKELSASQHKTGLGSMLGAGHPGMMARAADRDRKRLEGKLEELRAELVKLDPSAAATTPPKAPAAKKAAAKKSAAAAKTTGAKTKTPPRANP